MLVRLQTQRDRVVGLVPAVREDAEDAVHQMRVALRRSRSALASHRDLFADGATDALEQELRWLAGVLGRVRDAEVLRAHLLRALDAQPPEVAGAGLRRWVTSELAGSHRRARTGARRALGSRRFTALVASLDAVLAAPPVSARGRSRARDELPVVLAAEHRRLTKRVRRAQAAMRGDDPHRADEALHAARRAAKRARYAAETAAPVLGEDAARLARRWEAVQEVLGERQDSAVARQRLAELRTRARAAGQDAFALGRLDALEERAGSEQEARLTHAWARARTRTALRVLP